MVIGEALKKTKILLVIAAVALAIYLSFWYRYKKSMDEVSRSWYEKEYIGKQFAGEIRTITPYETTPYKIVLGIDDGSEFGITYGVTCVDQAFNEFVEIGDSVFKKRGSKYIRFCKPDNTCKEIELNFCDKFSN